MFPAGAFVSARGLVERQFEARVVPLPAEPFASVTGAAAACFALALAVAVRSAFTYRRSVR